MIVVIAPNVKNFQDFCDRPILSQSQARPLIGVDISSSSSVKMVELSGCLRRGVPGRALCDRSAVSRGGIRRQHRQPRGGRRSDPARLAPTGHRTKFVALALPASAVITAIILLAGLRDQELEVQVESEANQYPFALDEVNPRFQVIGPLLRRRRRRGADRRFAQREGRRSCRRSRSRRARRW